MVPNKNNPKYKKRSTKWDVTAVNQNQNLSQNQPSEVYFMNRNTLMNDFRKKFGGEYIKENGRWYWVNGQQKNTVSNSWLLGMLRGSDTPKQEVPPYEVSQHTKETLVKDARHETPVEEQEPENETPELSQEELKRQLQNQKRREKRAQRKLEKQKNDEQ